MADSAMELLERKVISLKYPDADIFWTEKFTSNGGKSYLIDGTQLRNYLKKEGFRNYKNEPIKLTGNIASKVDGEYIFKHVLSYVDTLGEPELQTAFLKQGETLLIRNKAIVLSLDECETDILKDSPLVSYHKYNNGVVKVTGNAPIEIIPYKDIKGFVWENSILDREFKVLEDVEGISMFESFLELITNDADHFNSICAAIGYLLHGYKDQSKPVCIIINDENLTDDGKPQGGTGKGIIVKGISHIVEKAMYNGKNSDFSSNKFAYQNVSDTTKIILIDDAPRNFDLEALFSVLTDDMPIEKKHKPLEVIPYESSPKFVITTNYTIKGDTSSFKRRRFDTFLTNYFNAERSPADDFGCEFFNGWDKEQWKLFDFFMMSCLRLFLTNGLVRYENEGLRLKMLKNETSADFYELMESDYSEQNTIYRYIDITRMLISEYGKKYEFLEKNHKIMVEWVDRFAENKGFTISKGRDGVSTYFKFHLV